MWPESLSSVMPGLVPGIHVSKRVRLDVDGRDKPGHDAWGWQFPSHYRLRLWIRPSQDDGSLQ